MEFTLTLTLVALVIVTCFYLQRKNVREFGGRGSSSGMCQQSDALDDVNNPAYNMENVIKQTILLEEHLAEDRKYCIPCTAKHFLHILGLVEEAQWMAGTRLGTYPLLEGSSSRYNALFQQWRQHRRCPHVRKEVLDGLRSWRQQLISAYILQQQQPEE